MELIELCASARVLALIDTVIAPSPDPVLVVEDLPLEDPRTAIDRRLVMTPTASALETMALAAGSKSVREL